MRAEQRETSVLDYFRSLRRGWPIVLIAVVLCGGAALVFSLLQKPRYEAQAALSIQDPNAALALAGAGGLTTQTPLELASSHLPQVTRAEVVTRVVQKLHAAMTPAAARAAVSVSVDPNSALVDIVATSGNAAQAAALANGFAEGDAALTTGHARQQYRLEAQQLSRRLLGRGSSSDPSSRAIYLAQLVRLQTLESVAAPVQVNATARVPDSPSSPRPVRNTLAGAIFGLLLGISLAYGREALDRRLRRATDVEEAIHHPIIGAVPGEAFGTVGVPVGGGAAENGGAPAPPGPSQEAFRAIRQNVRYLAADPLRVVLVTSAAPQEGKSTVAACLATAMAATGRRTLLVECDLRRPVLGNRLALPEGPGLTDYLTGHAEPGEIVKVAAATRPSTNGDASADSASLEATSQGVACITAGSPAPRPAELLASERFRSFLAEVGEAYDTVIVDSAPLLTVADTLELVPQVSGVLLCVRLGQTTRDQAHAVRTALHRLPERPVGVILTNVSDTDESYYGYYGAYTYSVPTRA